MRANAKASWNSLAQLQRGWGLEEAKISYAYKLINNRSTDDGRQVAVDAENIICLREMRQCYISGCFYCNIFRSPLFLFFETSLSLLEGEKSFRTLKISPQICGFKFSKMCRLVNGH